MSSTLTAAPALSPADRCDGCGAQAYVRVTLVGGGELLFCGHHWGRHGDAIKDKVASVQDETTRLAETPGTGSDD
jgi:hypothetical protein